MGKRGGRGGRGGRGRGGNVRSQKGEYQGEGSGVRKSKPEWHVDITIPKKKYFVTFGYLGNGYKGMAQQVNPADGLDLERTIEGDMLLAMKRADMVPPEFRGSLGKLLFSRVGRTDKGVHAAGQLCALKLSLGKLDESHKLDRRADSPDSPEAADPAFYTKCVLSATQSEVDKCIDELDKRFPDAFKQREAGFDKKQGYLNLLWQAGRELDATKLLQNELDPKGQQFRIHGLGRVTSAFDARKFASGRHYEYLLPSWLLCPVKVNKTGFPELSLPDLCRTFPVVHNYTRGELEIQHQVNQPDEIERRNPRKVQTFLPPFTDLEKETAIKLGCMRRRRKMTGLVPPVIPFSSDESVLKERPVWEGLDCLDDIREATALPNVDESDQLWRYDVYDVEQRLKYRLDDEALERFRTIVKTYQGTHSFHNFTSGMKPEDPACIRYMNEIDIEAVNDANGEQLVIVRLHGQSFLLNQIRKMVGLAVEVFRGSAASWAIEEAFALDTKRYVPMAPAEGLLLDIPDYESYNVHKASPPQTPFLPGPTVSSKTMSVNPLADDTIPKDFAPDAEVGALEHHMLHICDITKDIRESTENFKKTVVYDEVLRTVRAAWRLTKEDNADDKSPWRTFMLDLDWHPYSMENYPAGRIPNPHTGAQKPAPETVMLEEEGTATGLG